MVYSHCVQMNKNKIHIWPIWHRIIHLFGRNKTPSVAYYIHSITLNKILKCNNNKPTMKPSVFRSNVCIVLVGASLRPLCLPACLPAYFIFCRCHYWFCFIIFFILEWIKIGWLTEERLSVCVYDYLCAQFLVRFINDVTFNICETWRAKPISIYGLFLAVCFFHRPQILIVL